MDEMGKSNLSYTERMAWFHEARFGMFIHWGVYALLGRAEWVMYIERIPPDEYIKLADQFNPTRFNADAWVSLAQQAGMKYMVLTTRHHDGFCLFDSKVSDFTSVKTAAKRDFVAEYVTACRKAGMRIGLYYSLLDWRFPGYHNKDKYPENFREVIEQAHAQVRELLSNYGKIDILWYDGAWIPRTTNLDADKAKFWRAEELNKMARQLQPGIIINNRSGLTEDIDTPEGHVTASGKGRAWESCMTMGWGWGYTRRQHLKPTTQLIEYLVTAAAGAGNYLLNIGPKPDGTVRREEVKRLKEIGAWMKVNGESIYGSERLPDGWGGIMTGGMVGTATARGHKVYLHIFRWPGETAIIPGVKNKVLSAHILATGHSAGIEQDGDNRLLIKGLPAKPPDRHDTVIVLELDSDPIAYNWYDSFPLS